MTIKFIGALKWYLLARQISDTINAALSNQIDRAGVVPGAIAWDAADCGALYVSIASVYPSDEFPIPLTTPLGNCTPAEEGCEFVIQVMRCASGIGEAADSLGALVPPVDDLDADARVVAADSFEMMTSTIALLNSLREELSIIDYLMGDVTTMGPEGGVVGNELRIQVALPYGL